MRNAWLQYAAICAVCLTIAITIGNSKPHHCDGKLPNGVSRDTCYSAVMP